MCSRAGSEVSASARASVPSAVVVPLPPIPYSSRLPAFRFQPDRVLGLGLGVVGEGETGRPGRVSPPSARGGPIASSSSSPTSAGKGRQPRAGAAACAPAKASAAAATRRWRSEAADTDSPPRCRCRRSPSPATRTARSTRRRLAGPAVTPETERRLDGDELRRAEPDLRAARLVAGDLGRRGRVDDVGRVLRGLHAQADAQVGVGADVLVDRARRTLRGQQHVHAEAAARAGRSRRARGRSRAARRPAWRTRR